MEERGGLIVYDKFGFIKDNFPTTIRYAICKLIYESDYYLEIIYLTKNIPISDFIKKLPDDFGDCGGDVEILTVCYSKLAQEDFRVIRIPNAYMVDYIIVDLWS